VLTVPTVFVLGAGASAPFDFPIGSELTKHVVSQLGEGGVCFNALRTHCNFSPDEIKDFRDALFHSGKNSIDAFLEHRTEFLSIGKGATASLLIGHENDGTLFRFDNNWLRYLYGRLNTSFEDFGQNHLSIISFNYDRCVEHFLFTALKNSYQNKSDAECASCLANIPIIHLHGRLGFLPWQEKEGRPFRNEVDAKNMKISIENIKIIHEDISDGRDKDFERAKQILREAQRIYFIGFGYDPTNMHRLGIVDLEQNRAVGSAHGLVPREIDSIRRASNGRIAFDRHFNDCLEFLRYHVAWD